MDIDIIGASINLGANKLGVEKGPSILIDGINKNEIFSKHHTNVVGIVESPSFAELSEEDKMMKNKKSIFDFNTRLADKVYESTLNGHRPLVIGGDHSLSWGSISGITRNYPDLGVIYIDAHGDFNPAELSPSHNVHGMHMAYLMGLVDSDDVNFYYPGIKLDKNNVFFLGTRSLDIGEVDLAKKKNLNINTSEEIRTRGIKPVVEELLNKLKNTKLNKFHVSLDIDAIDPTLCPGTGVPEKNGITVEDVAYILEQLLSTGKIVSVDFVEFNHLLDEENKTLILCNNLFRVINNYWV